MATMPGAHREEQLVFIWKARAIIVIREDLAVKKSHMRIWVRREARSSCMSFQLLSLGKTCMRTMGERDGGLIQSSSPTRTPS